LKELGLITFVGLTEEYRCCLLKQGSGLNDSVGRQKAKGVAEMMVVARGMDKWMVVGR